MVENCAFGANSAFFVFFIEVGASPGTFSIGICIDALRRILVVGYFAFGAGLALIHFSIVPRLILRAVYQLARFGLLIQIVFLLAFVAL